MKYINLVFSCIGLFLFIACEGEEETPNIVDNTPLTVFINNTTADEGAGTLEFVVELSKAHDAPIEMSYATQDINAREGSDYTAVEGTLVFNAGETSKSIGVKLIEDNLSEPDEEINIQLSELSSAASFLKDSAIGTIDNNDTTAPYGIPQEGYETPRSYEGMELVWSDEFDGDELNEDNWTFAIGNGDWGWGNNELQYYTEKNAVVQDGYLTITAKEENKGTQNYTSARINSLGKQEFQYGRIDIRATMPFGQGMWPALWMLGSNIEAAGWPTCGEIDIMELVGHEMEKIHGTVHFGQTVNVHQYQGGAMELKVNETTWDQFHVYSIVWEEDKIEWYFDDQKYFEWTKGLEHYPFNAPFHFIINMAVGGTWPGSPDARTHFPQQMLVDYVRVFQ